MRNSHGFLLMPRVGFLSGFCAGVLLVFALAASPFTPAQDDPRTHPFTVDVDPNINSPVDLADTRLSLRVLRSKETDPTRDPTEKEDSMLVSRAGRGQTATIFSTESPEKTPQTHQPRLNEPGGSMLPPLIEVDPIHWLTDGASISITGMDPSAPRQLTLWRKQGDDVARVSLGQSNAMGQFEFAQVIVPLKGLELLVTGSSTTDPLMDPDAVAIHLRPPLPPPLVTTRGDAIDGIHFQLHPALDEGDLLIASEADGVIDHIHIEPQATGHAAGIELPEATSAFMDQDSGCVGYQVAQELADGRVSGWAPLPCAQLNL
jgi:hypothetical protein